jgi:hypothetical protein
VSGPHEDRLARLELLATVLLALATVATAWSSYQASRWNAEQAKAAARANALRISSAKADALANAQTEIDVATFTAWADAYAHHDGQLASFYRQRVRLEFKPALDAWIATRPLHNPRAPRTPFAMPQSTSPRAQTLDTPTYRPSWRAREHSATFNAPPTTCSALSSSPPRSSSPA